MRVSRASRVPLLAARGDYTTARTTEYVRSFSDRRSLLVHRHLFPKMLVHTLIVRYLTFSRFTFHLSQVFVVHIPSQGNRG
jgi:hypothetical protein